MPETIEAAVPDIVREAVARHGGTCGIAALSDALASAGRVAQARASAAFVRSARAWGDSLDSYDQRDRAHTGRFVAAWEQDVAEQISTVADAAGPVVETGSMASRAAMLSFRIRIGTGEPLTEAMLIDAVEPFALNEWRRAMMDTATAARRAFEDMERLNVHGNLLGWLADSYEVATRAAADSDGDGV